ncbi:Protein of unknown function [Lactobacillus helveticus CIRM-BIA 101]|nr:Protein of unknown function [Lactobacillus helveticus CIRM-BIA 101]
MLGLVYRIRVLTAVL